MLITSLVLFALAAVGGLFVASVRVRSDENPPVPLALIHGAVAAAGLVTLLISVATTNWPTVPTAAAGLFVAAALGGFVIFATHLRGQKIAISLVIGHAVLAVAGFVTLLIAVLS